MYIKKLCFAFLFLLYSAVNFAQITGTVTSSDSPEGLPGVNIIIKGTTTGTITDINGFFTIDASPKDTLQFSFVGYNKEEILVGDQTSINVLLLPTIQALNEVVVTALGIKREEKALGYSIQKVDGDDIAKVKEVDVVNSLSGKIAGVNITQADGNVGGGGSRIVIRGESSLAGNNDPLFIINGVRGSANDISPDDIESISVLKGPAAAALYGAEAGAGVVLITSKSGAGVDGLQVEYNTNVTFQTPLVLPEYQNKYGMGSGGQYSYIDGNTNDEPYWDDTRNNWGPEFDGELRPQFTGNNPWVAYEDNVKDFYEVGHIIINNFAISSSTKSNGNYRFSYTNTDQKGILPNTGLTKNNIGLNSQFKLVEKLTISSNINYIRTNCANNKQVDVRYIPRNVDIAALKDYWIPGLEGEQQMNYRRSTNNPYFELFENTDSYIDNKVVANISANYEILEGLNLMGRFGTNYTNNEYYSRHANSTESWEPQDLDGYYKTGFRNYWDRTAEFMASYERELGKGFSAKASFGGTHYRNEYKLLDAGAYSLEHTDIYNLGNRTGYLDDINDEIAKYEINSLYGFLNLDYKRKIFADFTYRTDWSSRLHPDNNQFSYPSASLSALITELVELPHQISFWKIRGNVAQVGKDIPSPYYTIEDKTSFDEKFGLSTLVPSDTKTDPYLKPEITTGYEVGTDVRFYNNRLGLDATVYYSVTENQILRAEVTEAATYDYITINAGEIESKGVEVTVSATPVKTKDFTWDVQLNWSADRSYLIQLNDTVDSKVQQVNSFLAIESKPDQRMGTFYGKSYERTPDGVRLYSLSGDTRLTEEVALGNYNPDWMASLYNTFNYKNISLSFLLDLRWGGKFYNNTQRKLNMYGLAKETLYNDREGIVPVGMVEESDGSYRWLTLEDLEKFGKTGGQSGQEYWANQMEEVVPENSLVDATYLKLRELRLSYSLPQTIIDKIFFDDLSVSIIGRNLAVWSDVKHVDPETFGIASEKNDFGFSTKVPGFSDGTMPSVRSFGFTVNCKF